MVDLCRLYGGKSHHKKDKRPLSWDLQQSPSKTVKKYGKSHNLATLRRKNRLASRPANSLKFSLVLGAKK